MLPFVSLRKKVTSIKWILSSNIECPWLDAIVPVNKLKLDLTLILYCDH